MSELINENISIEKTSLFDFHNKNNYIATLTAVRPPARFGGIKLSGKTVKYFKEKSKLDEGWINGGFFVLNKRIFDYIKGYKIVFEREPLQKLSKNGQLNAFLHKGFWKCMDNLKEKNELETIYKKNKNLWKTS